MTTTTLHSGSNLVKFHFNQSNNKNSFESNEVIEIKYCKSINYSVIKSWIGYLSSYSQQH